MARHTCWCAGIGGKGAGTHGDGQAGAAARGAAGGASAGARGQGGTRGEADAERRQRVRSRGGGCSACCLLRRGLQQT